MLKGVGGALSHSKNQISFSGAAVALIEPSDSSEVQMWLPFDYSTGGVSLVDRGPYAQKKGKPKI